MNASNNAKTLKKVILAQFRSFDMNPKLRVVGDWVRIGTSKHGFMIRVDGFVYRMTYSTGITGSNVTGTMDTLVLFILKQFGVYPYGGTTRRLSMLDKRAVKNLIAAGMVTEQYLIRALIKESTLEIERLRKQARAEARRLGLCLSGY